MKKEILKLAALLIFGAAVLQGCAIDNQGRRGRRDYRRGHHDNRYDNGHNYDRDHRYNGYR